MDEVTKLKAQYLRQIEDGQKIEMFTSLPEWQWYVEHVLKPTITSNTDKLLDGKFSSDKEDWIVRGIVQGLKMVIDGTTGFIQTAELAKKNAKKLQEAVDE